MKLFYISEFCVTVLLPMFVTALLAYPLFNRFDHKISVLLALSVYLCNLIVLGIPHFPFERSRRILLSFLMFILIFMLCIGFVFSLYLLYT